MTTGAPAVPIIVQHRLNLKSRKCGWTERLAIQSIKATWPLLSRKVASAHREKQLAQVSDFRAASFSCVFVCVALCFLSFDALYQALCHQHHQHHQHHCLL